MIKNRELGMLCAARVRFHSVFEMAMCEKKRNVYPEPELLHYIPKPLFAPAPDPCRRFFPGRKKRLKIIPIYIFMLRRTSTLYTIPVRSKK